MAWPMTSTAEEAIESLLRPAARWFGLVERCVTHHRNAGKMAVGLNQSAIARIGAPRDCLQPAGAVDVNDRWDQRPLIFTDLRLHSIRAFSICGSMVPCGLQNLCKVKEVYSQ